MTQSTYFELLQRAGYYNQRMTRSEFWTLTLVNGTLVWLAFPVPGLNLLSVLAFLVVAVFAMCQRLNDAEISRWWLIMLAIPVLNVLGLFWVSMYLCFPSYPAGNNHGPCRA